MFSVQELVDGMQISRSAFSKIFLRVQNAGVHHRVHFEAVARSPDRRVAFQRALEYAEKRHWLQAISEELISGNFVSNSLLELHIERLKNPQASSQLQAMMNAAAGFINPQQLAYGTLRGMQATVRILINGVHAGSGVLINSQHVLTAWHVVRQLFDLPPGGEWQLLDPAPATLELEFDTTSQAVLNRNGAQTRRTVHADWLAAHSCASHGELNDEFPGDPESLRNYYDYAIIKLDEVIDRNGFTPDIRAVEPRNGETLLVMQYPQQNPLSVDIATIARPSDYGIPAGISDHRFLHQCNSMSGSSGSPCFDRDFTLVGIHQGYYNGADGREQVNRGVPVSSIVKDLDLRFGGVPAVDASARRIFALGVESEMAPVIGCDAFQETIWESVINRKRRIFTVNGPGAGCGKTFRTEVLRAMLPSENHLYIMLPADQISGLGALEIAERICAEAGVGFLPPGGHDSSHSSEAVWLRDDVIRAVIRSIEQGRQSRTVWVMVTDLNKHRILNPQASEMLYMFYEQVEKYSWLRFILDGMRGNIPDRAAPFFSPCDVETIGEEQIAQCLQRTMNMLQLDVHDYFITCTSRILHRHFQEASAREPATCLAVLQREIGLLVRDCLKSLPGTAGTR